MSYKPGDPYVKEFTTASPTTGAAADADSLPTATADLDGSGTGAMALTVTKIDTGRYKAAGTVPGTRVRGDVLNVSVAATCGGVAGKAVIDTQVIDSKRVGDLNDAAALADYQQRGVAVTLPAVPTDWLTAAGVKADAVAKIQSGLSTYAGGPVASVTGSVGSVAAGVTVTTNSDKTGYSLASTGLDSIAVTAPSGVAATFPAMVVQVWRRFFAKSTLTATQLKTYAADGTTVVTTQTVSDDGTTQTQGAAS